jgi:hypothetical protein
VKNEKEKIILATFLILSQCFFIGCDMLYQKGYGTVKGYILFEGLQPATNVEILLGNTEFGGFGHPGNWITERRADTDSNGYFVMKRIEDGPWAIKFAQDESILAEYNVEPMYFSIDVKKT